MALDNPYQSYSWFCFTDLNRAFDLRLGEISTAEKPSNLNKPENFSDADVKVYVIVTISLGNSRCSYAYFVFHNKEYWFIRFCYKFYFLENNISSGYYQQHNHYHYQHNIINNVTVINLEKRIAIFVLLNICHLS